MVLDYLLIFRYAAKSALRLARQHRSTGRAWGRAGGQGRSLCPACVYHPPRAAASCEQHLMAASLGHRHRIIQRLFSYQRNFPIGANFVHPCEVRMRLVPFGRLENCNVFDRYLVTYDATPPTATTSCASFWKPKPHSLALSFHHRLGIGAVVSMCRWTRPDLCSSGTA